MKARCFFVVDQADFSFRFVSFRFVFVFVFVFFSLFDACMLLNLNALLTHSLTMTTAFFITIPYAIQLSTQF